MSESQTTLQKAPPPLPSSAASTEKQPPDSTHNKPPRQDLKTWTSPILFPVWVENLFGGWTYEVVDINAKSADFSCAKCKFYFDRETYPPTTDVASWKGIVTDLQKAFFASGASFYSAGNARKGSGHYRLRCTHNRIFRPARGKAGQKDVPTTKQHVTTKACSPDKKCKASFTVFRDDLGFYFKGGQGPILHTNHYKNSPDLYKTTEGKKALRRFGAVSVTPSTQKRSKEIGSKDQVVGKSAHSDCLEDSSRTVAGMPRRDLPVYKDVMPLVEEWISLMEGLEEDFDERKRMVNAIKRHLASDIEKVKADRTKEKMLSKKRQPSSSSFMGDQKRLQVTKDMAH